MSPLKVMATIFRTREPTRVFIDVRNAPACYTDPVATPGKRGPSFSFWLRIQKELNDQGLTLRELVERSGVTHTVIADLQTAGIGARVRRRNNVLALADALNIEHEEALQLAGLMAVPTDESVDVREAIRRSPDLDDDERAALFQLLDVFAKGRERRDRQGRDRRVG